jgi:hypothetical protein
MVLVPLRFPQNLRKVFRPPHTVGEITFQDVVATLYLLFALYITLQLGVAGQIVFRVQGSRFRVC